MDCSQGGVRYHAFATLAIRGSSAQNPRDRQQVQGECDQLLARATHAVARAIGRIWARHAREQKA